MATKTKSETFTDLAAEVGEQMLQNRRSILAKADEILEKQITENRPLNYEELDFLQSAAGWDRPAINDASRRVGRRLHNQAIAGTSKDREQLDKLASEAKAELKSRGPVIREQLAKLQAELNALEKNDATLSRRQDEVNAALDALTKCCSPAVTAACNAKINSIKSTIGRELSDQKVDLQQIRVLVAGPRDRGDSIYWENLRRFDRDMVTVGNENGMTTYSYAPAWAAKKTELANSISEREADIEKLEHRLHDELDAVQVELRQFWR